jgi:hypothetical protein
MNLFTVTRRDGGTERLSWSGLLAALEAGVVRDLAAMDEPQRPGVVVGIAVLMAVLRLYADRPRPWSEDAWRAEWVAQLGEASLRPIAPLEEPALLQMPLPPGADTRLISLLDAGTGFTQAQHGEKAIMTGSPEAWILAILGGMSRPYAKHHRASLFFAPFLTLPSDGTLASEVQALAAAYERDARRGSGACSHLPWLKGMPATPRSLADLPYPVLDLERAVRLLPDRGAVMRPSMSVAVEAAPWSECPAAARVVAGAKLATLRLGEARPWSYTTLHWILAGGEKISRKGKEETVDYSVDPPTILRGMTAPAIRLCALMTGNGKVVGYREALLPVPPPARSRLGSRLAIEASKAILADLRTARGALYGALVAARTVQREAALAAWDATAGMGSLRTLLDHIASDEPLPVRQALRRSTIVVQTRGAWNEIARTLNPLDRARGELALDQGLAPFADQEAIAIAMNIPPLAARVEAAIVSTAQHLTPGDRAALRSSSNPMPAWRLVAAAGEMATPALAALWRDVGQGLGRVDPRGACAGRWLARTGWPEARMRALLAAEGAAASGLTAEALRWLVAHGVERVSLTEIVTLAVAGELRDAEALAWARQRMALSYIAPWGEEPRGLIAWLQHRYREASRG